MIWKKKLIFWIFFLWLSKKLKTVSIERILKKNTSFFVFFTNRQCSSILYSIIEQMILFIWEIERKETWRYKNSGVRRTTKWKQFYNRISSRVSSRFKAHRDTAKNIQSILHNFDSAPLNKPLKTFLLNISYCGLVEGESDRSQLKTSCHWSRLYMLNMLRQGMACPYLV